MGRASRLPVDIEPIAAENTGVQGAERRREQRFLGTLSASTRVISTADKAAIGITADGYTIDLTANSLRLFLDHAVPVQGQLDIWIGRAGESREFYVTGLVRWVNDVDQGFEAGVELFEGALTDLDEWRAEISDWLGTNQ